MLIFRVSCRLFEPSNALVEWLTRRMPCRVAQSSNTSSNRSIVEYHVEWLTRRILYRVVDLNRRTPCRIVELSYAFFKLLNRRIPRLIVEYTDTLSNRLIVEYLVKLLSRQTPSQIVESSNTLSSR